MLLLPLNNDNELALSKLAPSKFQPFLVRGINSLPTSRSTGSYIKWSNLFSCKSFRCHYLALSPSSWISSTWIDPYLGFQRLIICPFSQAIECHTKLCFLIHFSFFFPLVFGGNLLIWKSLNCVKNLFYSPAGQCFHFLIQTAQGKQAGQSSFKDYWKPQCQSIPLLL